MRKTKPHSYEIYASSPALNAPLVIVEDKFSVWAFVFHGLWLIYKGAWRMAPFWFALYGGVAALGMYLGLNTDVISVIQLALQIWIGLEASTLLALDAKLRGLHLQSVIVANSEDDAEITYYRNHAVAA